MRRLPFNPEMSDRWERIATSYGGTVGGLARSRSEAKELLFAATSAGVFRSSDGARTWSLPGSAPTVAFASSVVASPRFAHDRTLFACGPDGLHRSSDGGDTWDRVLVGSRMLSVAVSVNQAHDALTGIAATETDGILRSEDGGRSWAGVNAGSPDLSPRLLALA